MADQTPNVLTDGPRGGIRTRLMDFERALRNDWPIDDEVRKEAVAALKNIIANAKSQRTKLRAIAVLIQAEALDDRRKGGQQPPLPPDNDKSPEANDSRQR